MSSLSQLPLNQAVLLDPNIPSPDALISQVTELHISCCEADGTIATFLPPWNRDEIASWYRDRLEEARKGNRHIFAYLSEDENQERRLAGFVMLAKPFSHTGPFRGGVEKLFVSPEFRKRGIAKKLLAKLEEVALAEGRTFLLLDTEVGSAAESVYPRLGYKEVGKLPLYAFSPKTGKLTDGVIFYKTLEGHADHVAQVS